jgi:hypothetical protein
MKSKCPYCLKELDFHELNFEEDLRAALNIMPAFERHAHLVMGYCYLFGVTPFRVKAKKLRLILEEMKKLFDAEAFAYQKKTYVISRAGIAEALDVVIKKHFATPLESHNYLKKIMIAIAEREAGARSRAQEDVLREKEEKMRLEQRPSPEEAVENLKRLNVIIERIGGQKK